MYIIMPSFGADTYGNRYYGGQPKPRLITDLGGRRNRSRPAGRTSAPGGQGGSPASGAPQGSPQDLTTPSPSAPSGPQSIVPGAGMGVNGVQNASNPFYTGPAPTAQDVASNPSTYFGTSFDPNLQVQAQFSSGPGAESLGQNPSNEGGTTLNGTYYPPVYGGATGYSGPTPMSAYEDNPYWGPILRQQRQAEQVQRQFLQSNPGAQYIPYGSDMPSGGGPNRFAGGAFTVNPDGQAAWLRQPQGGMNLLNRGDPRGGPDSLMYDGGNLDQWRSNLFRLNPHLDPSGLTQYADWWSQGLQSDPTGGFLHGTLPNFNFRPRQDASGPLA